MEAFSMARQSKREYLRSIHDRYRRGGRAEKTASVRRILQGLRLQPQICHLAIEPSVEAEGYALVTRHVRLRTTRRALRCWPRFWEASGYLCSQRLKAAMAQ
jgi:hypothetical protein